MTDPRTTLRLRLRAVRRRLLWIGSLSGAVWGLAGLAVLGIIAAWLDLLWELSPELRIAALAVAAGGAMLLAAVTLGRTILAARRELLARRLDRAASSSGEVLTGVELERPLHPACQTHLPALSRGLAAMAVARAAEVASRASAAKAVPAGPLRRSLSMLGMGACMIAILVLCLPGLARTQWRRFLDPYGDVPPYSSIEFAVEPGDTEVVYGDPLDIRARVVAGEADRLELVLGHRPNEEALPMFPEPDGRWRAALARVTEATDYHVRAYRARSARHHIGVITLPRIENVRFLVEPPAHTRLGPYQGPLPKGGVAGLPGTRVSVWAESNRPLSAGTLSLSTAKGMVSVAMKPTSDGGHEVLGQFQVTADGKFQLAVRDVEGQASRESFAGTITLLADERPFIRLIKPLATSLATPEATIPVVLSAEDDYGVSRLQLFRSLNSSRARPADVSVALPPARHAYQTVRLPLGEYGLRPGDVITLFGRVEDNDPAGAKGAESALARLRIISQEEFERMLRMRQGMEVLLSKYRETRRRLEKLAAELDRLQKTLEKLPPRDAASPELRELARQLAQHLQQESEAIGKSAGRRLPYDLDKHLTRQLEELARRLTEGAQLLDQLHAETSLENQILAAQIKKLAEKLGAGRSQFDREAAKPLEHMAALFPLMADAGRFVGLAAQQQDLADRLASLRGRDGQDDPVLKARMRDLEEEQRRIREELNQLLDDIGNHTEQLPDDPKLDRLRQSAAKFVKDVRASGAGEVMTQAESALAEFAGTRAHEKAAWAAAILAKFVKVCQPGESDGILELAAMCLVFQPALQTGLGDTVQQLLDEMGIGFGGGTGYGAGGYSARRSGNVGLYGAMPGLGDAADGRSGDGRGEADTADSSAGRGGVNPDRAAEPSLSEAARTAAGSGVAAPLEYRRRVGQYFQRIADEATKK